MGKPYYRKGPYRSITEPSRLYDSEHLQFMLAMRALKERLKRMPLPHEVLTEAIRLGYRKDRDITLEGALHTLRGEPLEVS